MLKLSIKHLSILLRIAIWVIVACALIGPVWLGFEFYDFIESLPDVGWNYQVARITGLLFANLVFTVIVVTFVLLYLWVKLADALPDLQGWHQERPESEFCFKDETDEYTFEDYLRQEDRVFEELNRLVQGSWRSQSHGEYSRFHPDSVCNPETIVDRNWNRSFVLENDDPIGGVLLIHGLSDSPYSLRELGTRLHAEGYTVIWLRVPGHGTCPSGLANVEWRDWTAAVRVAAKGLRERIPPDRPLILGGYSNGGALSVQYALASVEDETLPKIDAIALFSPMIGINPMARLTRLYHTVALVSRNKKAQWSGLEAEVDPFKYSSWPMNASVQAWAVTQLVEKAIARLEKNRQLEQLPPILAMQSVVDSTVTVPKLITVLFERLRSSLSELVLFDVNRLDRLSNLLNLSFEAKVLPKLKRTDLPYRLTVLRNESESSTRVAIHARVGDTLEQETTEMEWPESYASLSHIAVPIPPNDRVYGTQDATAETGFSLGTVSMRAEPSALLLSSFLFVRCRHNPFYTFMENRVVDWIAEVTNRTIESSIDPT